VKQVRVHALRSSAKAVAVTDGKQLRGTATALLGTTETLIFFSFFLLIPCRNLINSIT